MLIAIKYGTSNRCCLKGRQEPVSNAYLILPLVGFGNRSPDKISSNFNKFLPSRRSMYRSAHLVLARTKCELTHFVNVFFCTDSRSSVVQKVVGSYRYCIYSHYHRNMNEYRIRRSKKEVDTHYKEFNNSRTSFANSKG